MEKEKTSKRERGCRGSTLPGKVPREHSGVAEIDPNRSLGYRVDTSVETRKETPKMYTFYLIEEFKC